MSKLQIVQITDNDFKDLAAAFLDFRLGSDEWRINYDRITKRTSSDWGAYKTFTTNLVLLRAWSDGLSPAKSKEIEARVDMLLTDIDKRPKSLAWKVRARIGERKKWYQEPEPT